MTAQIGKPGLDTVTGESQCEWQVIVGVDGRSMDEEQLLARDVWAHDAQKERWFAGPVQIPCVQFGRVVIEKWCADGASPAFPLLALVRPEEDEPVGASIADLDLLQILQNAWGFPLRMR